MVAVSSQLQQQVSDVQFSFLIHKVKRSLAPKQTLDDTTYTHKYHIFY